MAGYPTRLALIVEEDFVLNSYSSQGVLSSPLSNLSLTEIKSGSTLPLLYVAALDSLNQIVRSIQPLSV